MAAERWDFIIMRAGFGGIGAAVQLNRLGYDRFVILDRKDDLGGTWHVNHYPGLAVDVPTTTYSYSFEANPNWSRLFTPGPEIKRYADDIADKYDVRRDMRFGASVESALWEDDEYDPAGERIAVIGTGATAVQLIRELAEQAADLTVNQRTPIWVVPKVDLRFPKAARRLFARVPWTQRLVRAVTDAIYESLVFFGVLRFHRFQLLNRGAGTLAKLHLFASIRDAELRRKFAPDYDLGCRRPIFSNSYYRTFTKPNVHLQADGIERVDSDGVVNADGTKTVIDTLVLATRFDLWEANFLAFEIIGRDDRNLGKWWRETRFQAYQGASLPHFPNFLSLASPYAFLGSNFFNTVEYQMRHTDRLFTEIKRRGATNFEITEQANDRYLDRMTECLASRCSPSATALRRALTISTRPAKQPCVDP